MHPMLFMWVHEMPALHRSCWTRLRVFPRRECFLRNNKGVHLLCVLKALPLPCMPWL